MQRSTERKDIVLEEDVNLQNIQTQTRKAIFSASETQLASRTDNICKLHQTRAGHYLNKRRNLNWMQSQQTDQNEEKEKSNYEQVIFQRRNKLRNTKRLRNIEMIQIDAMKP